MEQLLGKRGDRAGADQRVVPRLYDLHSYRGPAEPFLEFSEPILNLNKPAGLISRLRADGTPVINSTSSLQGVRVVDVVGWAPTADGLHFVTNFCTNQKFSGFQIVAPTYSTGNANEDALLTLLNGDADAMWVYADQAKNYRCSPGVDGVSWNCTRWTDGFGKNFAYVHTGMYTYAYGGTTLSMSKRGSGLKQILDPCITKFKDTKSYYDICRDNGLDHSCYKNAFFPAQEEASYATPPYETKTNELTTTCADGYCPCSS